MAQGGRIEEVPPTTSSCNRRANQTRAPEHQRSVVRQRSPGRSKRQRRAKWRSNRCLLFHSWRNTRRLQRTSQGKQQVRFECSSMVVSELLSRCSPVLRGPGLKGLWNVHTATPAVHKPNSSTKQICPTMPSTMSGLNFIQMTRTMHMMREMAPQATAQASSSLQS